MRTQALQIKDLSLVRALELAVAKEIGYFSSYGVTFNWC